MNVSSRFAPGSIVTVQMMETTRPPLRFISDLTPSAGSTASTVTPAGMSISTDVVATLPSVGTRTMYFSVAPGFDSRGLTLTCACAAVANSTAAMVQVAMRVIRNLHRNHAPDRVRPVAVSYN